MAPLIGLSSCIFHPDPERPFFKGKRLLYMEESMFHWVQRSGGVPLLIPTQLSAADMENVMGRIDGLLLTGGVDIAPECYQENAIKPEWVGDVWRDRYEIAIFKAALARKLPVLGICRGHQLVNVGLGGTLFQDIQHQNEGALLHRNWDIYEHNYHDLVFAEGSQLQNLYGGVKEGRINSVHHQSIKDLGEGLMVEARSKVDGIVEAVRLASDDQYVRGIQWHPEFHDVEDKTILDPDVIMSDFLKSVGKGK